MDYFLDQFDYTQGDIFFLENPIPVKPSAFVKYVNNEPIQELPWRFSDHRNMNMNMRMIEFLKKNPVAGSEDSERERGRRHMMSERIRRAKQKNSYLSLHSVLPPGTKNDKNSIVQVAAKEIEELRRLEEELKNQNYELERKILELNARKLGEEIGGVQIKMKVAYPSSSGIDSMLQVLKCLRETESNAKSIRSECSPQEFSVVLDIQSKMEAAEVEKAVQRRLNEVEGKFQFHLPHG